MSKRRRGPRGPDKQKRHRRTKAELAAIRGESGIETATSQAPLKPSAFADVMGDSAEEAEEKNRQNLPGRLPHFDRYLLSELERVAGPWTVHKGQGKYVIKDKNGKQVTTAEDAVFADVLACLPYMMFTYRGVHVYAMTEMEKKFYEATLHPLYRLLDQCLKKT